VIVVALEQIAHEELKAAEIELSRPPDIGVQSGYALLNDSITYRTADRKYSVAVLGENLTNNYCKQYGENINGLVAFDVVGRPLFDGVRVAADF
jgi:iron complex outermembrane recepter protein